ncbi:MAG: macro domain-containing protein [Xanthomonadaceae bacterium]|nr:macro domain-containing protein [Xanthomonadaceae bacterium]MDP2184476.1 macro domain-containing protein [Xanthomonadales bacterium]MDZ4116788.1 macro domain-containing protein [Xanthomonadaceae bacterium]MDZ4376865.1 macro domain-containing protein [Xanthomonadaceae bacterium]
MLRFTTGNLLHAEADAVVNTVNTVGVMGKGIALAFKDTYPENFNAYEAACRAGEVRVGRMFVTENHSLHRPRWIINFPTKQHWRNPSKLEWIRTGLADLRRVVLDLGIRSLALPPLGCGNGGLEWDDVRPLIEAVLGDLHVLDIQAFQPTSAYHTPRKQRGAEKLTPARALIAEAVRRYSILGIECSYLEVQKLAYFVERCTRALHLPDPLRMAFRADRYGPYSERLRHLLDTLDGTWLSSEKRLADAGPMDRIHFNDTRRPELTSYLHNQAATYLPALDRLSDIIDGFESPLGMELLATVDWLLQQDSITPSIEGVRHALDHWPAGQAAAQRKQALFDDRALGLALERLAS